MGCVVVRPARRLFGQATLPGDKSISHRYAILAALAEGTTRLGQFSPCLDCQSTLECLAALGIEIEQEGESVAISGRGLHGLQAPQQWLDAGNSGTTLRLLAGVLAGQPFTSVLTGDASLRRRPMGRIVTPLRQMGAEIEASPGEVAPLRIRGGDLTAMDYRLPVASAQVKSCLLLAALYARGTTRVFEPVPTRDHTERALRHFGVSVMDGDGIAVTGGQALRPVEMHIPGDLSSAMFLVGAALIVPDAELRLRDVGLNPTRTAALAWLGEAGARIEIQPCAAAEPEPRGDLIVRASRLRGGRIVGPQVAAMIDELPLLAALGPYTEQGVEIRDAAELRVKESDRIEAMAENLRRMGARVQVYPDGLAVEGRQTLRGAHVDSRGDHRIAMACAVAALGARGETTIEGAECVAVSFPGFFETLDQLAER